MSVKDPITTVFYIVAHADDWQLFMNPQTCYDLLSCRHRVVFIITTAGDAGMGTDFWQAREEAMKQSILYCLAPYEPITITRTTSRMNSFWVSTLHVNESVTYFLRLPDGGVEGQGFQANNFLHLASLETGGTGQLCALDQSLRLSSWSSFCSLLKQIILSESASGDQAMIKFTDPDPVFNPGDHSDHGATGRALLAISDSVQATFIRFKAYGKNNSMLLSPAEINLKSGAFAAYESTLFNLTGYSTLKEDPCLYQKWLITAPEYRLPEPL